MSYFIKINDDKYHNAYNSITILYFWQRSLYIFTTVLQIPFEITEKPFYCTVQCKRNKVHYIFVEIIFNMQYSNVPRIRKERNSLCMNLDIYFKLYRCGLLQNDSNK